MQEKEKSGGPAHVDMASQVHTQPGVPIWRGIFIQEKRKLTEGEVRTTELYYKHREFSCILVIA